MTMETENTVDNDITRLLLQIKARASNLTKSGGPTLAAKERKKHKNCTEYYGTVDVDTRALSTLTRLVLKDGKATFITGKE